MRKRGKNPAHRHSPSVILTSPQATLAAIRAVRERFFIGIKESQGRTLISQALTSAGLSGGSGLVLFGGDMLHWYLQYDVHKANGMSTENAALPHGSGTDKTLGPSDYALIDCGGSLHGYKSDVTRVCRMV